MNIIQPISFEISQIPVNETSLRGYGFYKLNETELIYAPESVMNSEFIIRINEKDSYIYPIYDWYYFEDEILAKEFFNVLNTFI